MAQSYLALPEDGLTVFEGAVPIKSTWASEGVGKRVSEMGAGYNALLKNLQIVVFEQNDACCFKCLECGSELGVSDRVGGGRGER